MADVEDKPKITLYWLNNSRSQRILWLLEELGVEYEVKIFHRDPNTMFAPAELEKIHLLGKSPVISVAIPGRPEPLIIAESGFIVEYLGDHFGKGSNSLVPSRWKGGPGEKGEGKIGEETDEWMRYRYFLHYAEGSLMPVLLVGLILGRLKSPQVPFFIRPISSAIANRVTAAFVFPNAKKHMAFLEQQLSTSGGDYLCGAHLTAADILMSFPLLAARDRFPDMGSWEGGSPKAKHPKVYEYLERLEGMDSFKRATKKIEEMEGKGDSK